MTRPPRMPRISRRATARLLTISVYEADIDHADALVEELRRRGQKTNRSAVIRMALQQMKVAL